MIVIDMGESTAILDSCFHLNFLLKSGRLASPLRIAHPLERFRAFTALLRAPASCRSRGSAVPRVPALLVPCTPFSCGSQLPPVSCDVIERESNLRKMISRSMVENIVWFVEANLYWLYFNIDIPSFFHGSLYRRTWSAANFFG